MITVILYSRSGQDMLTSRYSHWGGNMKWTESSQKVTISNKIIYYSIIIIILSLYIIIHPSIHP